MTAHLITGGAGFVAVNLTSSLLAQGDRVVAADDLSRGRLAFLSPFQGNPRYSFLRVDCSDSRSLSTAVAEFHAVAPITEVWHLAANSDISGGIANPQIDLHRTFLTTFGLLLVMRDLGIPTLHFASSSAIYGDLKDDAISETSGPPEPISNYGAMKLASEAQIRAAVEKHLTRANVFRFPNVVGTPATHGVILDLIHKARSTPDSFEVLGDGTQQKVYLHISDLIDAMLHIRAHATGAFNVFNIGPNDDGVSVRQIAEYIRDYAAPQAAIRYGVGNKGWIGDIPRFRYAINKLVSLGWRPTLGSEEAVKRAIREISAQLEEK